MLQTIGDHMHEHSTTTKCPFIFSFLERGKCHRGTISGTTVVAVSIRCPLGETFFLWLLPKFELMVGPERTISVLMPYAKKLQQKWLFFKLTINSNIGNNLRKPQHIFYPQNLLTKNKCHRYEKSCYETT